MHRRAHIEEGDDRHEIGGGRWTRTSDLGIMSPATPVAGKEDKALSSADSGKLLQNPQPRRNKKGGEV